MRLCVTVLILGCLSACAAAGPAGLPADYVDVPTQDGAEAATVSRARELADRGRDHEALVLLDGLLATAPRHVDAQRVRQDLLRRRGRIGLVFSEADRRIADWGQSASAFYLRGRLERDDAEKRVWFDRALAVEPRSFWGWFGLAYCLRDGTPVRASEIYQQLFVASGRSELVSLAYAAVLRHTPSEQSQAVLSAMRESDPSSGLAELRIAELALGSQKRREAWAPLLEALRKRSFDPQVRTLLSAIVGAGVADEEVQQVLDVLAESPERARSFIESGGGALLAKLYERAGRLPEAREAIARARPSADVRRQARRYALAMGDVRGFLDALERDLPRSVIEAESNQLRGLWQAVMKGPWARLADPLADPAHALALCDALVAVGLLVEAQTVATLARARHADLDDVVRHLDSRRDEARRELAFEAGLRRMLYRGYMREPLALGAFLAEVAELSKRVLGRDVVGTPKTFHVPLVGELVDPNGEGLAAHLRKYNRHLALGQRGGSPPEGILLTRLSLRDLDDAGPLPLPGASFEVIGEERQIASLQGLLGGDLAGIALLNHYVLDSDAIADWAQQLFDRRVILREDGNAVLDDPLPDGLEPTEPLDVAWRLLALSPVEDNNLEAAVLDMVRWHERAHLADAFRYLPPERNLWRVLGLVIGNGFSASSVEAEMEGRAETAAAAFAGDPYLVLAHIATFLEADGPSTPHAAGFRQLAQSLNEGLARDGDPVFGSSSRWHRAQASQIRALARELVAAYWP